MYPQPRIGLDIYYADISGLVIAAKITRIDSVEQGKVSMVLFIPGRNTLMTHKYIPYSHHLKANHWSWMDAKAADFIERNATAQSGVVHDRGETQADTEEVPKVADGNPPGAIDGDRPEV